MVIYIPEVATLLRRPEKAVRKAFLRGELPGRKIAGRWCSTRAAILEHVSGSSVRQEVKEAGEV